MAKRVFKRTVFKDEALMFLGEEDRFRLLMVFGEIEGVVGPVEKMAAGFGAIGESGKPDRCR